MVFLIGKLSLLITINEMFETIQGKFLFIRDELFEDIMRYNFYIAIRFKKKGQLRGYYERSLFHF